MSEWYLRKYDRDHFWSKIAFRALAKSFVASVHDGLTVRDVMSIPNIYIFTNDAFAIGFIGFKYVEKDGFKVVHISALNISDKFRNRGYGRELLTQFIELIKKDSEQEKILLGVNSSNKNAIKLYKSLGFINTVHGKEGTVEFDLFEYNLKKKNNKVLKCLN